MAGGGQRIDADLVRCLLREQLPQWADEPVSPVTPGGWDNRTFRVGAHLSARLPSAAGYVAAVAKEQRWLPVLAAQLPVPVPTPVARGRPGCGYPWPWSVYRWLPGVTARPERVPDLVGFARDLARFLAALHRVDPTGGPAPGAHSFGRGGPLIRYDDETRALARSLRGEVDADAVLDVWAAALAQPFGGPPVWLHGDLTASNLLVEQGRLAGVLDWGTSAVGDPACDLVIAWTFLDGPARQVLRDEVAPDPGAWARTRGWVLWKALLTVAEGPGGRDSERRYGWRCSAHELVADLVADHQALS
jgi:aminoglycoside phosphotransferase (APT) family kinase protein